MKTTREEMKTEAVKRMKRLGLFKPCISAFEKRNEIQISEPPYGALFDISSNEKLVDKIKEVEKENGGLVYHVIHTYTDFGEIYNLLWVTAYAEEWDYENADIKEGYVFVYRYNASIDYYSEFGSIAVEESFGGLKRIG